MQATKKMSMFLRLDPPLKRAVEREARKQHLSLNRFAVRQLTAAVEKKAS